MRQVAIDSQGRLVVQEAPEPQLSPNGILAATQYSLISAGTEIALIDGNWRGLSKDGSGWVLGYSVAGIVQARGAQGPAVAPGDLVACAGYGYACHADTIYVPRHLVSKVPASPRGDVGVSPRAACFTTLGTIATHAVRQGRAGLGDVVLVIGMGVVGQLIAQVARAAGARVVATDLIPQRLELARSLGAERAVLANLDEVTQAVNELSGGIGADAALLCTGAKSSTPLEMALAVARDRGVVVGVGADDLNVPRAPFYNKELTLTMSRAYGPCRYDPQYEVQGIDYPVGYVRWTENRNMGEFLRLLAAGLVRVEPLITHEFSVEDAVAAYDLIRTDPQHTLGVVLRFT